MDPREAFERWKHFDEAARTDIGRMTAIAIWLLSLGTSLLVFIGSSWVDLASLELRNPPASMLLSLLGAALSIVTIAVVNAFGASARQSWRIAHFYEDKAALTDAFAEAGGLSRPTEARLTPLAGWFLGTSAFYLLAFTVSAAWTLLHLVN